MKIALLGNDPEVQLLAAAAREQGHEVSQQALPSSQWQTVLAKQYQGAIVGRSFSAVAAERDDMLRKLVQEGLPLLLVHPGCEPLLAYELDMILHETKTRLAVYAPGLLHPLLDMLQPERVFELVGEVAQIALERPLENPLRPAVLEQFARDALLLRKVAGEIDRLSALGDNNAAALPQLNVHMTSAAGTLVRWSVMPASSEAKITMIGSGGQITLAMPDDFNKWSLVSKAGESQISHDDAAAAVSAFTQAGRENAGNDWRDACQSFELATALEDSLRRGKTIELHHQGVSERGAFQGTMAVGGCLLILLSLFVLFVAVLVESLQLPLREFTLWRLWPLYLAIPLVIFVLLQLLHLALPKEK